MPRGGSGDARARPGAPRRARTSSRGSRPCSPASGRSRSSRASTASARSTRATSCASWSRSPSTPASRRAAASTRPLHDALVAAGYDRTFEELADDGPPDAAAACGGGEVAHRRAAHRRSARRAASISAASPRGTPPTACVAWLASHGPALVNAGGDLAVSGRRRMALAGGGRRAGRRADARARARRSRHLGPRPPALAAWRRGAPPPDRPATLRPAQGGPLSVTVAAASAAEAEVLREGPLPRRRDARARGEALGIPCRARHAPRRDPLAGGLR